MRARSSPRILLRTIADQLGVSKQTVSLALRGDARVHLTTMRTVRETADRLGYSYNPLITHVMSALRRQTQVGLRGKLALFSDPHPVDPSFHDACLLAAETRARASGFEFDRFTLFELGQGSRHWQRVLRWRNLNGMLLITRRHEFFHAPQLAPLWQSTPAVVAGAYPDTGPGFATIDHRSVVITALAKARDQGWCRPALVCETRADGVLSRLLSAHFLAALGKSRGEAAAPCLTVDTATRPGKSLFGRWLQRTKPDGLLTLGFDGVALTAPPIGPLPVIQLDWNSSLPQFAGLSHEPARVGEAAVELLLKYLDQRQQRRPLSPGGMMVRPEWREAQLKPAGNRA